MGSQRERASKEIYGVLRIHGILLSPNVGKNTNSQKLILNAQ